jgi:hypothetical protein
LKELTMERRNIDLDPRIQALDGNAQQVIVSAAEAYLRDKQRAAPTAVAPMDAGRPGDEQFPAPIDAVKLVDTSTDATRTVYDVEISYGGNLDLISINIADDGSVEVRGAA